MPCLNVQQDEFPLNFPLFGTLQAAENKYRCPESDRKPNTGHQAIQSVTNKAMDYGVN